jgi:Lon protease-like protein
MSTERLPLFPLRTVLFPGGILPLHIFEKRYRLMITECLERDERFGVCLIRAGEEVGEPAEPHRVGTEAEILDAQRLPDGRMLLFAVGRRRFGVVELTQEHFYLAAEVSYLEEDPGEEGAVERAARLRAALPAYLHILQEESAAALREAVVRRFPHSVPPIPDPSVAAVSLPEEPLVLSYLAPSLLQGSGAQRQALLEEMSTTVRLERLIEQLEQELQELSRARQRRTARDAARHRTGGRPGDPTIH